MEVNLAATGFWKINNTATEYHGDLYLNEESGGIIIYIRIPNERSRLSYFTLPLKIPFITGATLNGAEMTLVNCTRISTVSKVGTEEVFGYQAQFMLEGICFDKQEDIKFTKMRISIPGIIQWGSYSNYILPDIENKNSLIDLNIIEPIEIYSNTDYKLLYYLSFSSPFYLMEEETILKQIPFLIIETTTKRTLDWFMKKANKMKNMIEIAMGRPLSYGSMVVESSDFFYEFEDHQKHIRPIEVIHSYRREVEHKRKEGRVLEHEFLFDLKELKEANFSQWEDGSTELDPIIELYIDSLYNKNLSVTRHFLNMIQALETYHSRRMAFSLKNYKKRVEKILEVRHKDFRDADREFLLKGCERRQQVTLRSRLADLLLAEFRFFFYTGNISRHDFPQVITDSRNYYTHYNPRLESKALKGSELVNAFYILRNILEFYLLKELGFQEDFVHKRTRNRINHLKISDSIQQAQSELVPDKTE